jgi:hypothetical protein
MITCTFDIFQNKDNVVQRCTVRLVQIVNGIVLNARRGLTRNRILR